MNRKVIPMKQPKVTRAEYDAQMQKEVERLIADGKMPGFDEILRVIQEVGTEYRQKSGKLRRKESSRIE